MAGWLAGALQESQRSESIVRADHQHVTLGIQRRAVVPVEGTSTGHEGTAVNPEQHQATCSICSGRRGHGWRKPQIPDRWFRISDAPAGLHGGGCAWRGDGGLLRLGSRPMGPAQPAVRRPGSPCKRVLAAPQSVGALHAAILWSMPRPRGARPECQAARAGGAAGAAQG